MFKAIRAKNMFSWKNLEYIITPGITLVGGFNFDDQTPEGSGKSAIPNIMCWTLFGKMPKDVKIDEVISYGKKTCFGEVELEDGTIIRRSRKPNDLRIIPIDGEAILGKDAKDTQALIVDLIGLSFETFCQSVYFAQNYERKFINSNETEKSKILSEIQDLSQFDKARNKVQELESLTKQEILKSESEIIAQTNVKEQITNTIDILKNTIANFDGKRREQIEELSIKLDKSLSAIEELAETLTAMDLAYINQQVKYYSDLGISLKTQLIETRYAESNRQLKLLEKEKLQKQLLKYTDQLRELSEIQVSLKGLICPTCSSTMRSDVAHKQHVAKVDEQHGLLKDEQAVIIMELDDIDELLARPIGSESEIEREEASVIKMLINLEEERILAQKTQQQIEFLVQVHDTNKEELEKLQDETDFLIKEKEQLEIQTKALTELECKIKNLTIDLKDLQEKCDTYAVLKASFKEIKSFVFSSFLKELSKQATEYAQELFEIPVFIRFFNESEEGNISKILTEVELAGVSRALGLLSGGQFRRIQISVDLALSNIIASRSQKAVSFRVLDEPFKDLSEKSMDNVLKLLEGLSGSTILIEHNSMVKSIVHKTFSVEYREGVSEHAN